jgi:CheY-like chemotaxis protein
MSPKTRILYIDDEADLLDLAASFFEEENIPIHTCTHMQGALEMVRSNDYDLIITDVRMPTGNGFELLSAIRKEGRFSGKVIMVTGNVDTVSEAQAHGCDQVLFKPLRFQDLIDNVKTLLKL